MTPRAPGAGEDWRAKAVVEALTRHLEVAPPEGDVLVLADPDTRAARLLEDAGRGAAGPRVRRWSRVVSPEATVSPWPPSGPWSTVALRLPRAKDELEMLVHAAASILEPGGTFLIYGANDEGIRSAPGRIEPLFGRVDTVVVKSRCRVLRARRPERVEGLKGSLAAWRETWRLVVPPPSGRDDGEGGRSSAGFERSWVSYPGLFSHGRLDSGTRLLLDSLGGPMDGARVLDYGCGSGVIGGVLDERAEGLDLHLLDPDAVALEAARENLPGARLILGDGLHAVEGAFDLIVSNPPYHRGNAEDRRVLESLVREAPAHLEDEGDLVMVVQRRFPVEDLLRGSFHSVEILGEDATYRVWRGG